MNCDKQRAVRFDTLLEQLSGILSRKDEDETGRFACPLHGNPEDPVTALMQMGKENLANLHSQPSLVERVQNLRRMTDCSVDKPAVQYLRTGENARARP